MARAQIQLPPYPASGGPATANQTDTYVGRYRQRVAIIQRELAECELAFEQALARADAATATRAHPNRRSDRIARRGARPDVGVLAGSRGVGEHRSVKPIPMENESPDAHVDSGDTYAGAQCRLERRQ